MSGSEHQVICPKCKTPHVLRGKATTIALACSKCHHYFGAYPWVASTKPFVNHTAPALKPGTKGRIDGKVYEVMGYVVKQEQKHKYYWREYVLFNPYEGYAFLSEYDGNWNFFWPLEGNPRTTKGESDFYYENNLYKLYQRYQARVTYAEGEFPFDVVELTATTRNKEYISPPYVLAYEINDDSLLWCQGEYMTPKEVADAFKIPVKQLPEKKGRGYTQPVGHHYSERAMIITSVTLAVLALVLHIVFLGLAEEKALFSQSFTPEAAAAQKVVVSPSFTLEGHDQGLEVYLEAPLNNDWFFAELSLINEGNGMEYNFTKDLEYYYGYEDGSSWSEGSKSATAYVSQIPPGTYHLNIYPEFSLNNHTFTVMVRRGMHPSTNIYFVLILLGLFPLLYYIRRYYIELRRWSDSEYSPYNS